MTPPQNQVPDPRQPGNSQPRNSRPRNSQPRPAKLINSQPTVSQSAGPRSGQPPPAKRPKRSPLQAALRPVEPPLLHTPKPPPSPWARWWAALSLLGLLGIGAGVVASGWIGLQFLTNPRSLIGLNQYLPEGLHIPIPGWDQPRTLAQIQTALQQSGSKAGSPVYLGSNRQTADLLLPVIESDRGCVGRCERIVELRIYRPIQHPFSKDKEPYFQLINQRNIEGLEEWFVVEPLVNVKAAQPGGTDRLGLAEISTLSDQAPSDGVWLNLQGRREEMAYGQILHYDPGRTTLNMLADWTSPNGTPPSWLDVTGDGKPELVVDQTVGLEPQFQILRVLQPLLGTPKLEAITLLRPALSDRRYEDALLLARNGLWSLALQKLQALKKDVSWSDAAQQQLVLIQYHAKVLNQQADRASASTSQQVQANLMDGRWEKAAQVVKAAPDDRDDVINLLEYDSGKLWKRISMALQLEPGNPHIQAWAAAMRLAQNGKGDAIAWLKKQPVSAQRTQVLKDLNPNLLSPNLLNPPKPSAPKNLLKDLLKDQPLPSQPPLQPAASDARPRDSLPIAPPDPSPAPSADPIPVIEPSPSPPTPSPVSQTPPPNFLR
jgi:hypothetical protein